MTAGPNCLWSYVSMPGPEHFYGQGDLFFYDMYCGQVPTDTPAVMYLTTLLVSPLSWDHFKLIVATATPRLPRFQLILSSY